MSLFAALGLATLAVASRNKEPYTLAPEAQPPIDASQPVEPSFPSFGIQVSSFPSYTGNVSHPNTFSANLVREIEKRTGGPLVIRVGGTNGDYSNFDPHQSIPVDPPMQGAGIGQKFVLGPSFYEGFHNFAGTRWVYDIPFAKKNHTDSIDEARAAINHIGYDLLEGLEIGNEVDLYVKQESRPAGWGPQNYTTEFLEYADFLTTNLGLPEGPIFQVLTLSAETNALWSAKTVFEKGITKGNQVKSVSFHHYEYTNTTTGLQQTLMNHTFVTSGVDTFRSDFDYMKANFPEVQIVLGESGRYTNSQDSLDPSEGIFGSALWTVDYLLYAMSLNVTRVNMQLSKVFGYVAWHPVAYDGLEPGVRAPYYGHLFVGDFMNGTRNFQVSEIPSDDDLLAAYAGYENNQLARVAIINYEVWNSSDGDRPTREFTVKVPANISSAHVSTLTSPGGASSLKGFHWAGQSWTFANNGIGQVVQQEYIKVNVENGQIQVSVSATEAVLITLYP